MKPTGDSSLKNNQIPYKGQSQQYSGSKCNFMSYLAPSEMALEEQQRQENYEEMMKELSEGVYLSHDAFVQDEGVDSEDQEGNKSQQNIIANEERKLQQERHETEQQYTQTKLNRSQQVKQENNSNQMEASEQQRKSDQDLQTLQNKKVQTTQENDKLQQSQQQFYFAESMSHYQSVMQFANSTLMEEVEEHQSEGQRLQKIQEQIDGNEETNKICVQSILQKSLSHQIQSKIVQASFNHEEVIQKEKNIVSPSNESIKPLLNEARQETDYSFIKSQLTKFTLNAGSGKVHISITGYEKEFFLKMQTQIYLIDVHNRQKKYSIRRRFADFVALQQIIKFQYSGCILYPFPQSSMEYFKKTKLSIGNQQQKIVLIERRLFELQRYVNSLFSHRQISISSVLHIFIQQNYQIFQKQINRIQSISLSQEKDMQLGIVQKNFSSIKKLVRSNFTFLSSYFPKEDEQKKIKLQQLKRRCMINNDSFTEIRNFYQTFNLKLESYSTKVRRLATFQKDNSQQANFQSNIDSVLSLSSKLSSSGPFYTKFYDQIQDCLLNDVIYYENLLRNIESSINYRVQLINKINSLETDQYALGDKLQEKIRLFDDRFLKDWRRLCEQFEENVQILFKKFNNIWRNHCTLMCKIWK